MDKFLIALDIDGTLLNKKKEISFITKHYLRKLSRQGHIIVLASGRPFRSLKKYYDELQLHSPIICYNGSLLFAPKDDTFPTFKRPLNKETVINLYQDLVDIYAINVTSETDDTIYSKTFDKHLAKYFHADNMKVVEGNFKDTLKEDVWTMIFKRTETSKDDDIIKEVNKYDDVEVRFWGMNSPFFEMYPVNVSKCDRLFEIAKYYDIPKERIIAIGDADNDSEMIEKAGIGVCMINGYDGPKMVADIVTKKDNNHNGIVQVLKEIFRKY